jgi:hypothetical protein
MNMIGIHTYSYYSIHIIHIRHYSWIFRNIHIPFRAYQIYRQQIRNYRKPNSVTQSRIYLWKNSRVDNDFIVGTEKEEGKRSFYDMPSMLLFYKMRPRSDRACTRRDGIRRRPLKDGSREQLGRREERILQNDIRNKAQRDKDKAWTLLNDRPNSEPGQVEDMKRSECIALGLRAFLTSIAHSARHVIFRSKPSSQFLDQRALQPLAVSINYKLRWDMPPCREVQEWFPAWGQIGSLSILEDGL